MSDEVKANPLVSGQPTPGQENFFHSSDSDMSGNEQALEVTLGTLDTSYFGGEQGDESGPSEPLQIANALVHHDNMSEDLDDDETPEQTPEFAPDNQLEDIESESVSSAKLQQSALSFWQRAKNFILRRKPSPAVQQQAQVTEAAPAESTWPGIDPELSDSDRLIALQEMRDSSAEELYKATARYDYVAAKWEALQAEIDKLIVAQTELQQWLAQNEKTFAAQILVKLQEERTRLVSEVSIVRQWLDETLATEEVATQIPRARFVKKARKLFIVALALTVIALLTNHVAIGAAFLATTVFAGLSVGVIILGIAVASWLTSMVSSLFTYYREWSIHRRRLDLDIAKAKDLTAGVAGLRSEKQRLDAVHNQIPKYLEFLSEVVHTPWVIVPAEHEFLSAGESLGETPASLRIATIPRGRAGIAETELTHRSVALALRPSWRSEAFNRLLGQAALHLGVSGDQLGSDVLDRDEKTRDAFLTTFRNADIASKAGSAYIRELASLIQSGLVSKHHPLVIDTEPDPLAGLELGTQIDVDANADLQKWDEFLGDITGPAARWATLTLSDKGRIEQAGETLVSVAFGPTRITPRDEELLRYEGVSDDVGRPLEMVVRVDYELSLDATSTTIFTGANVERRENAAPTTSAVEVEVNKNVLM